jgi:acetyltransferase
MLGLGGIFVEVFGEVVMRVAPISHQDAAEMIESLRGVQILKGTRGQEPSDLEAVKEALLHLSQLLVDFSAIMELDINPLRVFHQGEGCRALDARMILS